VKNILLLIHDDEGQEARFQAALDLARATEGHLTCVDLTVIPEFVGDYVGDAGVLLVHEQATEACNKMRMLARLEHEDVPFDWIDRTGFVVQTIEDHARLADVIVLSSDSEGKLFPHMADVAGDVLVRLGKLVLVVPPQSRALCLAGRAMVAWDGSQDAETALQAALPLLGQAANVTLYYADDHSSGVPAEDAARYLSRHGIAPVVKQETCGIDRPGTAVLTEAKMGHYDYVVMGAFSRSRTIETIFGGATSTMLKKSPIPIFLAHRR
jgi:nucleotide-binding universal stress UspA family protein